MIERFIQTIRYKYLTSNSLVKIIKKYIKEQRDGDKRVDANQLIYYIQDFKEKGYFVNDKYLLEHEND